jgi:hypothetical protein
VSELDFQSAPLEEIAAAYFSEGCVLLRHFAAAAELAQLIQLVDHLYKEVDEPHVTPGHLEERGLRPFHEHIFRDKHYALLTAIFGDNKYKVCASTGTRRVGIAKSTGGQHWGAPLRPHLDAFFHPIDFTVNFWVPFRDCGIDAPSLGVVRVTFGDVLEYSRYGSISVDDAGPHLAEDPTWNFHRFDKKMFALACGDPAAVEEFRRVFAGRIWTPRYQLGDAMMSSNWTLHFTHALPTMTERRGNIELRFISEPTVGEIIEMHQRTGAG